MKARPPRQGVRAPVARKDAEIEAELLGGARRVKPRAWELRWRDGFVEEATYGLPAEPAKAIRAHAAALRVAPGEVEGVLLERVLASDASRLVRRLDIAVHDFARFMLHATRLIASRPRPQLEELALRIADYSPYKNVMRKVAYPDLWNGDRALLERTAVAALTKATPNLRRLTLVGDSVMSGLEHPTLEALTCHGYVTIRACGTDLPGVRKRLLSPTRLPRLERLTLEIVNPSAGSGPPMDACYLDFPVKTFPALKHLDLSRSDLGDELGEGGVIVQLAGSKILPRLETLVVRAIDEDDERKLRKLAPRFAHLGGYSKLVPRRKSAAPSGGRAKARS